MISSIKFICLSAIAMAFALAPYSFAKLKRQPSLPPSNDALFLVGGQWWINHPNGLLGPGNMPNNLTSVSGGCEFVFPISPVNCDLTSTCNFVGYVQTWFYSPTAIAKIASSSGITMTFTVQTTSGNPVFDFHTATDNTGTFPVHVRFILEQFQTFIGTGYDRWWSNPIAAEISATTETVTLSASFDPSQWSSVYGEFANSSPNALAGFQTCMANIGMLGFTFGGGSFFGHGCFVDQGTGNADFVLTNFQLVP